MDWALFRENQGLRCRRTTISHYLHNRYDAQNTHKTYHIIYTEHIIYDLKTIIMVVLLNTLRDSNIAANCTFGTMGFVIIPSHSCNSATICDSVMYHNLWWLELHSQCLYSQGCNYTVHQLTCTFGLPHTTSAIASCHMLNPKQSGSPCTSWYASSCRPGVTGETLNPNSGMWVTQCSCALGRRKRCSPSSATMLRRFRPK